MKIEPFYDRVVVKRNDSGWVSASGIIIPNSALDKPSQGVVVAVGEGKRDAVGVLHPLHSKVGDNILFGIYAGQLFKMNGEEYLTMKEDEIIGRIIQEQGDLSDPVTGQHMATEK